MEANIMSHKYKILEQMFKDGKLTLQEFQRRCDERHKELERYNELIKMETHPFGSPALHEHI